MTALTTTTPQDTWSLATRAAASLAAIRAQSAANMRLRGAETATTNHTSPLRNRGEDRTPELDGICDTLRKTDVFGRLGELELQHLAGRCSEQKLARDCQVFRRGDASNAVFIIREGSVAVFRDQRGRPVQELARLGAGNVFGELGVLHGVERGASVRTTEPCRLLRIEKAEFRRFLREHGAAAAKLEGLAARRHCRNAAAALDIDTRSDVRIRVDAEVILLPADGKCCSATLENISRAGLSLTGAPADWKPPRAVSFALISGGRHLDVTGRVSWRRNGMVGISFPEPASGQARRVSSFTRKLLEELS